MVATHIRLAPRVADPEPHYDDVVADVGRFLSERAAGARAAGIPAERIVLDAGLDLGKTAEQSLTLLRASSTLAALGYPLLLSASNKTFLGKVLDLELTERREASLGAAALGISWGCRIVRVHDVKGTCRGPRRARRRQRGGVSLPEAALVYLVKGDDASLVAQEVRTLLDEVVGDRDHALVVEEIGGARATTSTWAPWSTPA